MIILIKRKKLKLDLTHQQKQCFFIVILSEMIEGRTEKKVLIYICILKISQVKIELNNSE